MLRESKKEKRGEEKSAPASALSPPPASSSIFEGVTGEKGKSQNTMPNTKKRKDKRLS
jgi:hypothetical protein